MIENKYNKLIGLCKECGRICLAETKEKMAEIKQEFIDNHGFPQMNCPICNGLIYEILPIEFNKEL